MTIQLWMPFVVAKINLNSGTVFYMTGKSRLADTLEKAFVYEPHKMESMQTALDMKNKYTDETIKWEIHHVMDETRMNILICELERI